VVAAAAQRASAAGAAPKARMTSSVAREYELAQKASARLEEEIARQAKLDAMLSQVSREPNPNPRQRTLVGCSGVCESVWTDGYIWNGGGGCMHR